MSFARLPWALKLLERNHSLRQCRFMSTTGIARPYQVHIGASYAAKPAELLPRYMRRRKVPIDFPESSDIVNWRQEMLKRPKGVSSVSAGEDFFFIQEMRNKSGMSFGVADGVGGWSDVGVDPSLFSQAIMYHAHRYSKQAWVGEPEIDPLLTYEEREQPHGWEMSPQECLELAYGGVLREKTVQAGSSTACIININTANGLLRSANLGDSGYCIIRSLNLLYYQEPQIHYFNCPKQLSKVPANYRAGDAYTDSPRDADIFETKLKDGDIVVCFTDGLSDNVFVDEILSICGLVKRSVASEADQVQDIADRLIQYARACMAKDNRVSPFEIASQRESAPNQHHRGGKIDDVTVVVAMIREAI